MDGPLDFDTIKPGDVFEVNPQPRPEVRIYIGIDNGASGGIAALTEAGGIWRLDKMPTTEPELLQILQVLGDPAIVAGQKWRPRAVLEHAQAFPKMGVSGAFTYGAGYGAMKMALYAAGIPFDIVVPRVWQRLMGCLSGGDKNVTKRRAEQLFPAIKVTHALADALLMAEYCRRCYCNVGPQRRELLDGKEEARGAQQGSTEARGGESRQEFENDRAGETGERLTTERRAAERAAIHAPHARRRARH